MCPPNGSIFVKNSAIALLILLIHLQPAECQKSILDSTFTFRAGSVKTINALNLITKATGYNFTYDSRLINPEIKTEMTFSDVPLNVILDDILKRDSLVYSVIDKYIIISKAVPHPSPAKDTLTPAQSFYISGLIVDDETLEPLPFATVAIKNKGRGTVANSNGEYGINIPPDCLKDTLYVSYLGYIGRDIPVEASPGNNFTITMQKEFIPIPEIIIRTQVPQEIIYKTLSAIDENYGTTPAMLTGFYREGVLKKTELQNYSEAVLSIYKSAYDLTLFGDQIKVLKSRKIENSSASDTLAVRLKAGLSTCLELDGVKNTFDFINRENMPEYTYRITDIVSYDEEAAYVIDFEQKEHVENALYRGSVYINAEDFAILQADFELNPRYMNKMKDAFISSSARKFTTWPVSVKYSVSYRKVNSRYFLSHVRGDLVFSSKQKRRLFNSTFNVFFELAITGNNLINVNRFEREELAPIHSVFTKTIISYDPGFWENLDFLKPEDNLLQALRNMNAKLFEFSDQKN